MTHRVINPVRFFRPGIFYLRMVGAVGLDRESLADAVGDSELTTPAYSGKLVMLVTANPVLGGGGGGHRPRRQRIIPWYAEVTRSLL